METSRTRISVPCSVPTMTTDRPDHCVLCERNARSAYTEELLHLATGQLDIDLSCAEKVVTCAGELRPATIKTLMGAASDKNQKAEFCKKYRESVGCMTNITAKDECRTDTDVRLPKLLLKNGYGRFCTEDNFYEKYQTWATCFRTNIPASACYKTYVDQAEENANNQMLDQDNVNFDELCNPITTLIHCVNQAIGGTCGEEALLLAKLLYPGAMLVEIYDCMSDIRDKTGDDLYMKMTDPQDRGSYLPWTSGATYRSPTILPILAATILLVVRHLRRG